MRTEITFTPHQLLRGREDYVKDKDGRHRAAGLEVVSYYRGVHNHDGLSSVVRGLVDEAKGQRGARRKHIAWEITLHPTDANGAKSAFRSVEEMRRVAEEVLKEFSAKYALVGFHGLQDIHLLILNWGETGLALKSHLPNRSNPRRVLVAVADRIEKELNIERAKDGAPLLCSMQEVREAKRKGRGRLPLHDEIARHLSVDKEPSVADILKTIAGCGWQGMVKAKKVYISFTVERPSSVFELDLFLKGVIRAWRLMLAKANAKEKERAELEDIRKKEEEWKEQHELNPSAVVKPVLLEKPHYETLISAVHDFMRTGKCNPAAVQWLEFLDGDSTVLRSVRMTAALGVLLTGDTSAAAAELHQTLEAVARVRDQRVLDLENEGQKKASIDP